jgi:hypothetical protein
MASARVTICSPFSNDRRQRLVINANQFRNARSYAKSAPPRFHKWAMSMAAACDSAADLPRVTCAVFTAATKERFGPVRFELFLAAFRCSGKPIAAIAMALMTAPIEAAFPPSASLDRDRAITAPKRSGSDLMEIRDRPLLADCVEKLINVQLAELARAHGDALLQSSHPRSRRQHRSRHRRFKRTAQQSGDSDGEPKSISMR